MATGQRAVLAICVLIILVIAHYKLMKEIQVYYQCQFLLLFSTAVIGIFPIFVVNTILDFELHSRNPTSARIQTYQGNQTGQSCLDVMGAVRRLGGVRKLLLQSAFVGILNTLAFFTSLWAITKTALWISLALFKVDCAFNLVLSIWLLGETCSIWKVSGALLSVAGAVLLSVSASITRDAGGSHSNSLEGDIISIIYALELSILMVAWKKFLEDFSWSRVFAINGISSFIQTILVFPVVVWAYASGYEGGWSNTGAVLGLCVLNGLVSLALALWWSFCIGYTSPTYVAVAGVLVVPLTTLLDYLTYRFELHWLDGVATTLIIIGFLMTRRGYNTTTSAHTLLTEEKSMSKAGQLTHPDQFDSDLADSVDSADESSLVD